MSILFFIVPLLVFVIVDTFASLNIALVVAVLVALGELIYSYSITGEIDSFSVFSVFLLCVLGGLSYFKQSRRIFYLKPAILSFATGIFLLGSYLLGYDILLDMMERMNALLTDQQKEAIDNPMVQKAFKIAPFTLGIASLLHAALATFAALKLGRWSWFLLAVVGSYVFLVLGLISATSLAALSMQ